MASRKLSSVARESERPASPFEPQSDGAVPPQLARIDAGPGSPTGTGRNAHAARQRRLSETRCRKASDLAGLAVYSWDPVNDTLECDDNLRSMWGISPGDPVDPAELLSHLHPDDRKRVEATIAASLDPSGDGHYDIEYRVIGRDDGIERWISASAQVTFEHGRAIDFIGAAVDVTQRRSAEAAIRTSEARFRAFARYSADLLRIIDPTTDMVEYRSPAYERIWGEPVGEAPMSLKDWLGRVHPDDRRCVQAAFETLRRGEPVIHEYRIVRPDKSVRRLRETSFPIRDEEGHVARIGGIAEDLTIGDVDQIYMISPPADQSAPLAVMLRGAGFQVRSFDSASKLLEVAAALAPGCILVDVHVPVGDGIQLTRALKARSIPFPTIIIGRVGADPASIVAVMKAGATDYLIPPFEDDALTTALAAAMAEMRTRGRERSAAAEAATRVAHLTPREREMLEGLVDGGTNKTIARRLGISPRTVELHRSQVMNRLDAGNLSELIQTAMTAGL